MKVITKRNPLLAHQTTQQLSTIFDYVVYCRTKLLYQNYSETHSVHDVKNPWHRRLVIKSHS